MAKWWDLALLTAGVVFVAAMANRFAPEARGRVRRTAYLYMLYVGCTGVALALTEMLATPWATRVGHAAALFESLAFVNIVAITMFDVTLPAARVRVPSITSDIVVGVAYIVAFLGVLRAAGTDPTSVLATSAIVSGILALSLQATLGNILGGIALQLDGSIHGGDWVQLENGKQGKVVEIRWRYTVLETRDWDTIIVPNASLLASQIVILGKKRAKPVQHRMTLFFNVDFSHPPVQVIDVVNEALRASPLNGIADDPPPHCLIYDLAKDGRDSFGFYLVRYWLIDLDRDDGAQSLVRTRVYAALRRAGIPLARPASTVVLERNGQSPEAVAARTRQKRIAALASLDPFDDLADAQRQMIADRLEPAPFNAGEVICAVGTDPNWLFLLVKGRVEVRTGEGRDRATVATLEAPDFFGEMGLLTGEKRAADVVAVTNVELFRIGREAFEDIMRTFPDIAEEISHTLAHRRVELIAAREGLDARSKKLREVREEKEILERIRAFFGMGDRPSRLE